ncbi:tyrosine-type recombinase/integrase [Kitasatospora hibisci]|uniref:tyrosine-type recombinase/integrase n=1 Tax=Kitasatospora hibisci TaxID=3369522 RepID=UPI0037544791
MLLFSFSRRGWESWGLPSPPHIPEGMPVLIDEDLHFEDANGPRPTTVINRWLRDLPSNGAHSPETWNNYASMVKAWAEHLTALGIRLFADRDSLKDGLALYAQHRLSGPLDARLAPGSWNLHVKTVAAFYNWAAANGHCDAIPFNYAARTVLRPDGTLMEAHRNLATVRGALPHASRKYLETDYRELLVNALAGLTPDGEVDTRYRGRQTGRNAAGVRLALSTGLRRKEWRYLTVWEIPALPKRPTRVPVPVPLAPPTTKGGRGRQTWIDYDDLVAVRDYIELERAAYTDGSRWRPEEPLWVENPNHVGAHINGRFRRWHLLTPAERLRLVAPEGGCALFAVQQDGSPFLDWATVLRRASERIRESWEPAFPHVHPHMTRHTFAMATLERLVRGYYQQAARLVIDTNSDDAMALYLTKADPLLVLRDLLGHASVAVTQVYLHMIDTLRVFHEAYENATPDPAVHRAAAAEFEDDTD